MSIRDFVVDFLSPVFCAGMFVWKYYRDPIRKQWWLFGAGMFAGFAVDNLIQWIVHHP